MQKVTITDNESNLGLKEKGLKSELRTNDKEGNF
jgi:hypothetical protein